ncbi:MAG: Ribosomal protein [Pseudomonadota bacterium]|jgi:small subunit ribosomal protein S20
MANTRKSTKRAGQTKKRQERNNIVRSSTKTAVKQMLDLVKSKDAAQVKAAYTKAIKALGKAASKGAIPQGRASRKISRLTHFLKANLPAALTAGSSKK